MERVDGLLVQKILRPGYVVDGRFSVTGKAEGAKGELYEARDGSAGRSCMLRVFTEPPFGNERIRENAMRLAARAKEIRHPGIVEVIEAGTFDEGTYIAMERVPGDSLHELSGRPEAGLASILCSEEPLTLSLALAPRPARNQYRDGMEWGKAMEICLQACNALQAMHESGIIHRALSPDKLMLARDGSLKLLYSVLSKGPWPDFAQEGHFYGAYRYAAPEQYKMEHSYDHRVDVYAVGITAYALLTGIIPLFGDSFLEIRDRRSALIPQPPSESRPDMAIPEAVDSLVLRAMHPLPQDRFGSCAEMASHILAALASGMN